MSQHEVTFLPHNRKITVDSGESLIRAAMEAGVHVNASCGGEGVCGKCRVLIESGNVAGGKSERLSAEDLENGYRLACQAAVASDLTVRIPVESAVDTSALGTQVSPVKQPAFSRWILRNSRKKVFSYPRWKKSIWNFRCPMNRTTSRT